MSRFTGLSHLDAVQERTEAMRRVRKSCSGQSLVEILVALGISAIMLPALATSLVASRDGQAQESERLQATALLRDTNEAVRSVREKGWSQFATNGTYHPVVTGSTWSLAAGAETIGSLTRQVVIADVQRDTSGAIVTSGGTVDPSTKKVTTTISWNSPFPSTVTSEAYYQRYLGNAVWLQTRRNDFNRGTFVNTDTTNVDDGEVVLVAGAGPAIVGTYDASGNDDANDVFIDGNYAYLVDGASLMIIDISNPAAPTLTGTYNAGTAINGVYVSGSYAYLASTGNAAELTVVNITNKSAPTLAATRDLGNNNDATSIYVSNGYAYVGKTSATGTNRELYIINVGTPTNPSITGSFEVAGDVLSIFVSGNYAYLATTVNTQELIVVNVTNKAAPTLAGSYDANSTSDAQEVFIDGTTAYLVTLNNNSGPEFYSINVSNPAAPTLLGSYNVGADATSVYVIGTRAYLTTALANKQFLMVNVSNPAAPTEEGGGALSGTPTSVMAVGSYAYLSSTENNRELIIMPGSPGGAPTTGTFESEPFDADAPVAFNYLSFTIVKPVGADVRFQLAINNDNATWNYFGPDGTAATYYTVPGAIPFNLSTGRYIRYKATLTGNGATIPQINDVSINYSP